MRYQIRRRDLDIKAHPNHFYSSLKKMSKLSSASGRQKSVYPLKTQSLFIEAFQKMKY